MGEMRRWPMGGRIPAIAVPQIGSSGGWVATEEVILIVEKICKI
jgi:hypothetical protein